MSQKIKKELDLIFTRDFSLFVCEFWRDQLLLKDIKRVWGATISDQIINYNGRVVESFRIHQETERMKNFIINLPLGHKLFSKKIQIPSKNAVRKLRSIIKKYQKKEPENYYEVWKTCLKFFSQMYPCYMFANFLPGPWAQSFREAHGKSAEKILREQYKNRLFYEGIFENTDIFLRKLVAKKLILFGKDFSQYSNLLTFKEVEHLFNLNKAPALSVLEKRKNGYVIIGGKLIIGKSLKSVLSKSVYYFDFMSEKDIKEIKGVVAYKSKTVIGKVKIVFTQSHINNFPSQSILVAAMTAPNFLPAMKKSSAIVTDEGGVTCHAAITARELKIPTIIATKIATKALKNDDLIKVDTQNGKIEILKK